MLVLLAALAGAVYAYRSLVPRTDDIAAEDTGAIGGDREPSDPSLGEPAQKPKARDKARKALVINGTGDVNLDPSYIPGTQVHGHAYTWSGVAGLFREDDLTVINLECAPSELGTPVPKEYNFRCDLQALGAARAAGVDVANLANNHSGDFGPEALTDGMENVLDAGIAPVGVGRHAKEAGRPAVFEIKGWRVAVLGFGGVVPDPGWLAGASSPGMADGDSIESMVRAVRAADRRADLVFVTIHWGMELDAEPRPEDVERAHALIDAGADGIFGHHSHRLNPLGFYKGKPIAWGLGNFVWHDRSPEGSQTAVAQLVVRPNGKIKARLIPAVIESRGHPVLVQ